MEYIRARAIDPSVLTNAGFFFCIAFRGGALHDEPKNGCEGDYLEGSKQ